MKRYSDLEYLRLSKGQKFAYNFTSFFAGIPQALKNAGIGISRFFKKIGLKTHQVRNAILIGGGTISYYVAKLLLDMRIDVKIIEKDLARCEYLSELLPEATLIHGDGADRALLLEEGIRDAEALHNIVHRLDMQFPGALQAQPFIALLAGTVNF